MFKQAIHAQYAAHRGWTYQLHYDNLAAWVEAEPELGSLPSYATVRRYMKSVGLTKRRKLSSETTEGVRQAERRLDEREVRMILGENAAKLYGFDLAALEEPAARLAITPEMVRVPLDEVPADSACPTFQRARFERQRAAAS